MITELLLKFDKIRNYIVLLVLVVGHDGDDGVVNEQAKGQDPREAWERRSENRMRYNKIQKY